MMIRRFLGLAAVAACALSGQQTALDGPVSGLVFDRNAKSLRMIVGVPGAAYLGADLGGYDIASVSPDGRWVLAASSGSLRLLPSAEPRAGRLLMEGAEGIESIVWSEDSTAAAVAYADHLELWRKLAGDHERIQLAIPAAGSRAGSLAVMAGGEAVAAGFGESVFYLDGGSARLVARLEQPGGLLFDGTVLYAADRARNQILAIRNYAGSPEISLLASGLEDVTALSLTPDRKSILAAGGTSRLLSWLNPATGETLASLALEFEPNRVQRIAGGRLYLLRDPAGEMEPVQVLDAGAEPAVYFVPAGKTSQVEE
jgi:hypothetical protein